MLDYSIFNYLMPLSVVYCAIVNIIGLLVPPSPSPHLLTDLPSPGRVAIVTGSNTGIGYCTALGLAEAGYLVVVACRNRAKGEDAVVRINGAVEGEGGGGGGKGKAVFVEELDLSSLQSVANFIKVIDSKYPSIHILVNNAGINTTGVSKDNYDLCYQTNFLGHFLLTTRLLPNLLKCGSPRVVNLSSVMHHFGSDFTTVESWMSCLPPSAENSYANSKLSSILFTLELNRLYASDNLLSISVNPGAVNSDIWRSFNPTLRKYVLDPAFRLVYLTTSQGSTCSLAAALSKDLDKSTPYLQPYLFPKFSKVGKAGERSYTSLTFPLFEMLGIYVGYTTTKPRLPGDDGGEKSAKAMWKACETAVGS